MVFPLLAVGGTIVAAGIAWGAKEFGEESGKKAGTIIAIAAIAIVLFFILRKRGKV